MCSQSSIEGIEKYCNYMFGLLFLRDVVAAAISASIGFVGTRAVPYNRSWTASQAISESLNKIFERKGRTYAWLLVWELIIRLLRVKCFQTWLLLRKFFCPTLSQQLMCASILMIFVSLLAESYVMPALHLSVMSFSVKFTLNTIDRQMHEILVSLWCHQSFQHKYR